MRPVVTPCLRWRIWFNMMIRKHFCRGISYNFVFHEDVKIVGKSWSRYKTALFVGKICKICSFHAAFTLSTHFWNKTYLSVYGGHQLRALGDGSGNGTWRKCWKLDQAVVKNRIITTSYLVEEVRFRSGQHYSRGVVVIKGESEELISKLIEIILTTIDR